MRIEFGCIKTRNGRAALAQKRGFALSPRNRHNRAMGSAGKYTVKLFDRGGEGSGLEAVLDSDDVLDHARAL